MLGVHELLLTSSEWDQHLWVIECTNEITGGELQYVTTNVYLPFPSLIEWLCGAHCVYKPTLKRSFVFHFLFPFLLCDFFLYHVFHLHVLSSFNPNSNRSSTNKKRALSPSLLVKVPMERH